MGKNETGKKATVAVARREAQAIEKANALGELNRKLARINRETLIQLAVTKKKQQKR